MRYEQDGITIDPEICGGKATITGHRITVQTVLEYLGAGDTPETILEYHSSLTAEDIAACLRFAARSAGRRHQLVKSAV